MSAPSHATWRRAPEPATDPGILGRLTSDGGRAFMLLDAAVGDLA